VHSFNESKLGILLLTYILIVLSGTLYLVIDRHSYLKGERHLDSVLSRESAFIFNNLILVISCIAVFVGTMFPVFSEKITGTKIALDAAIFNKINVPIGLILLFLTGVGPIFAWRKTSLASLKSFLLPAVISIITCACLFTGGIRNLSLVCLTLCAFVAATIIEEFYKGARIRGKTRGENFLAALANLTLKNKRRYGGYIVHLAMVLMFMGFAGNAFNRQSTKRLATGEEMSIGDYSLKMTGYHEGQTPNYQFGQVALQVFKNGKLVGIMKPERRFYKAGEQQSTTTVALKSTPKEDLYVVFAGMSEESKAEIAVHLNPLVFWIWFGSAIMVLGAIITLIPEKLSR
jgi:cytochrome c-type biogenesis protein CcmF